MQIVGLIDAAAEFHFIRSDDVQYVGSATGCVVNGTISIINATYNAYKVQFSYASCTGRSATLNGLEFNGMATLDNTQSPEHAIVAVTAKSGAAEYAVALNMPRT